MCIRDRLRIASAAPPARDRQRDRASRAAAAELAHSDLSTAQQQALAALKAWRAGVAKEHNLPAFIIFHDSTLHALAQRQPQTLADLQGVPGVGQKKREAYGPQVLEVLAQPPGPALQPWLTSPQAIERHQRNLMREWQLREDESFQ